MKKTLVKFVGLVVALITVMWYFCNSGRELTDSVIFALMEFIALLVYCCGEVDTAVVDKR